MKKLIARIFGLHTPEEMKIMCSAVEMKCLIEQMEYMRRRNSEPEPRKDNIINMEDYRR